jgi:hypothetical protein
VFASVAHTATWFAPIVARLLSRSLLIATPALWALRLRATSGCTVLPLRALWTFDGDLLLIACVAALILVPPLAQLGAVADEPPPLLQRASLEHPGPQAELNQLVVAGLVLGHAAGLYDRRDVMRLVLGERQCSRAAVVLGAAGSALLLNGWLVDVPLPDRLLPGVPDAVEGAGWPAFFIGLVAVACWANPAGAPALLDVMVQLIA